MIFGTAPPVPALNKWLKVFPPVSYFLVAKLAHGVVDHCLKVVLGSSKALLAGKAARPMSVDELVGLGDDDTFIRAQAVRKQKALLFLQRPITQRKLCVAALVCKVVMSFMGLVFRLAKESHRLMKGSPLGGLPMGVGWLGGRGGGGREVGGRGVRGIGARGE